MYETTSKLFHKLRRQDSAAAYLSQDLPAPTCSQALLRLLDQSGKSVSYWITAVDISKSYGYQILRGERHPGRDILLRTALCLGLTLKDTQRLLAVGCCGALYPRIRRDAAIIFALNQHMTLLETEDLLISLPERSLYAGEF